MICPSNWTLVAWLAIAWAVGIVTALMITHYMAERSHKHTLDSWDDWG